MTEYKSNRFMDGKVRLVIVDETGKVVNRNPNKDELKGLENEIKKVRSCYNCGSHDTYIS